MTVPDVFDTGAAFRPRVLRQYALPADSERGAPVGPHGDITRMCAPRWDSDAVFSSLTGGGVYAVTPQELRHVRGGHYQPGTLIRHRRWITGEGAVECREALAHPGRPRSVVDAVTEPPPVPPERMSPR
jgi:alpha,alpha-trehalase